MLKKVIFIVCDGLGDRPIPELNDRTPLEAAHTPNLDALAKKGAAGLMHTCGYGVRPGSDTAHLALFGYDPHKYYTGRGPFEVSGINMEMQDGDVALRVNAGTVNENLIIQDRRAGNIEDTSEIVKYLGQIKIGGVTFILKDSLAHRIGLIMRGKGLSGKISDSDEGKNTNVKVQTVQPLDDSREAKFTADVLNKFLKITHGKLKTFPWNKERIAKGLLPANFLLTRGAGMKPNLEPFDVRYNFHSCCIAGGPLYKGVGRLLGMETFDLDPAATGKPNSDLSVKTKKLFEVYNQYNFFFIHYKGADTAAEHDGYKEKMKFIEKKIDPEIGKIKDLKDAFIVVTADHSTPCSSKLNPHSGDPVPILVYGGDIRTDDVKIFSEIECAKGILGQFEGIHLMSMIQNFIGKAPLFGA